MGYRYHTHGWPVVHFEFIGRLTAPEADQYFSDSNALVTGRRPYSCVMDGTRMLMPEVEFVRKQATWIQDNRSLMLRVNRGIAFVVPSTLVRGLVRAVLYYQDLPVAHASFSELDEALTWAKSRSSTVRPPP